MANVQFVYSSSRNITFHGTIDSGISREDWDEMSAEEQAGCITDAIFDLVDIGVVEGE